MKKPKHWYCETWKMNFYFCIGWRPEEFQKYMKKSFDYEFESRLKDGSTLLCNSDQGSIIIIWTRKRADHAVLTHESVHAANMTLSSRGWRPELENDEPQAYLVESIFRKATA